MTNKLNPNYKHNKIRLELMSKLLLIDKFVDKGLLRIDKKQNLVLIDVLLFISVCTTETRFRAFLNNVYLWLSYEYSRDEVSSHIAGQPDKTDSPSLPEIKPFDINVIGEKGTCVIVGKYDGVTLRLKGYNEIKTNVDKIK